MCLPDRDEVLKVTACSIRIQVSVRRFVRVLAERVECRPNGKLHSHSGRFHAVMSVFVVDPSRHSGADRRRLIACEGCWHIQIGTKNKLNT